MVGSSNEAIRVNVREVMRQPDSSIACEMDAGKEIRVSRGPMMRRSVSLGSFEMALAALSR